MNLSTMHGLITQIDIDYAVGRNLRILSAKEAWETIEDCAQCDKQWKNTTSTIFDQIIANLKTQLVENEVVRVKIPKCMAWLDDEPVEEVDETIGIPTEVEPLDYMKLEDIGLNTCNYEIPLSSKEVPSFDKSKPQPKPLANFLTLDVSLGDERDDPKKHYRFKLGLLELSGSLGVDLSKLGMIDDDWELESKECYASTPTYLNLGLGELAHTKLIVELVDRTVKYPKGIAKNVLVGDEKIIFKSVKPASSLIKRVYMLSLRERMELDLEARLMEETLVRNQVDKLLPTIKEGEVIDAPVDDIVKSRNDELNVGINDYPILEDMDAYRDEGMGDVIVGEPFLKEIRIEARRFDGMITIYNGDQNPIRTLGDYSKPSHDGYRNTIELPVGNNVVPLRSNTIQLVQNGCSFYELRSKDPNQHLKDFLKLVDSLDIDSDNRERTRLCLFQFSLRDQASNWLERLSAGSITTWEDLATRFLAQFFPSGRTAKLRNDILMFQQHHGESLSKAWTRFKDLLQKVPHHGIDL
ncbi:zinc finger, CCHC-type containing protein [Tanacetum coccineum]